MYGVNSVLYFNTRFTCYSNCKRMQNCILSKNINFKTLKNKPGNNSKITSVVYYKVFHKHEKILNEHHF